MKAIAAKSENWIFSSIILNMASISDTWNVYPVFNFDPFVLKHL